MSEDIKGDAADALKAKANATAGAAADFATDPADKADSSKAGAATGASAAKDGPKAPDARKSAQASAAAAPKPEPAKVEASQAEPIHPAKLRPAARPTRQGP